jgi:SAM-dependent methyltransferase
MQGWDLTTFGESMTDYDLKEWAIASDEAEATDFLAALAKGGRALELGVGTGRIAIPLAHCGVRTVGIEASESMAAQLARKLQNDEVAIIVADFADVPVDTQFEMVYCVYNTFFLLLTQEAQVRCFRNSARILAPGGTFVLQASVPEARLLADRQSISTLSVGMAQTVVVTSVHDPVSQRVDRQQVVMTDMGNRLYPLAYRYAWPSELDLMASMAGLALTDRWGGWRHERFTGTGSHVSVYQKPDRREEDLS